MRQVAAEPKTGVPAGARAGTEPVGLISTTGPADESNVRREGNVRARGVSDQRSTHRGASRDRHRIGRAVACLAACTLLFPLLPGPLASAADPRTVRDAREVRSIWTEEFGVSRPVGLTYLPGRNEFIVAEAARRGYVHAPAEPER